MVSNIKFDIIDNKVRNSSNNFFKFGDITFSKHAWIRFNNRFSSIHTISYWGYFFSNIIGGSQEAKNYYDDRLKEHRKTKYVNFYSKKGFLYFFDVNKNILQISKDHIMVVAGMGNDHFTTNLTDLWDIKSSNYFHLDLEMITICTATQEHIESMNY